MQTFDLIFSKKTKIIANYRFIACLKLNEHEEANTTKHQFPSAEEIQFIINKTSETASWADSKCLSVPQAAQDL